MHNNLSSFLSFLRPHICRFWFVLASFYLSPYLKICLHLIKTANFRIFSFIFGWSKAIHLTCVLLNLVTQWRFMDITYKVLVWGCLLLLYLRQPPPTHFRVKAWLVISSAWTPCFIYTKRNLNLDPLSVIGFEGFIAICYICKLVSKKFCTIILTKKLSFTKQQILNLIWKFC